MIIETSSDIITILKCRDANTKATKHFTKNPDGTIKKVSFSAGMHFTWEERKATGIFDLSNILTLLMDEKRKFVVRGGVKDRDRDILLRRINEPGVGILPTPRHYVMLDIDKQKCPEYLDPARDPESVVRWVTELLPEAFNNVTCFYKFSSSQSVPTNINEKMPSLVSVHLWFWCSRAVSDAEWKRYFNANYSPVDRALFNPVQIHFTANPIFENMTDPLFSRAGIIEYSAKTLVVPAIPEATKAKPAQRTETSPKVNETNIESAIRLLLPYCQHQ